MQAVAVAAERSPGRPVETPGAMLEQLHRQGRNGLAARRESFDVCVDTLGPQHGLEAAHLVRSFDVVVGAFLGILDRRELGEYHQRAVILPIAMEDLRVGMWLAIGKR